MIKNKECVARQGQQTQNQMTLQSVTRQKTDYKTLEKGQAVKIHRPHHCLLLHTSSRFLGKKKKKGQIMDYMYSSRDKIGLDESKTSHTIFLIHSYSNHRQNLTITNATCCYFLLLQGLNENRDTTTLSKLAAATS